jgi:hypothetical protein
LPDEKRNMIGAGQPGVMAAKGTMVNSDFTYSPSAGNSKETKDATGKVTGYTNTVDPNKRTVTQTNIDALKLNELKFDKNNQATLGTLKH